MTWSWRMTPSFSVADADSLRTTRIYIFRRSRGSWVCSTRAENFENNSNNILWIRSISGCSKAPQKYDVQLKYDNKPDSNKTYPEGTNVTTTCNSKQGITGGWFSSSVEFGCVIFKYATSFFKSQWSSMHKWNMDARTWSLPLQVLFLRISEFFFILASLRCVFVRW